MNGFQEILEDYGADYTGITARFMGNEAMYLRLLDMLFQDDNPRKLGSALSSGNISGAFEAAHTLKCVTGNMGLTPLYKAICAIVKPLRSGERYCNYSVFYQAIRAEFEKADMLRKMLKGGEKA